MNEINAATKGDGNIWVRGLYMLLFVLFYSVAEFVLMVVVVVQFGYRVLNNENHPRILALGAAIALYIYLVLRFLSFNSDEMPYPFSDWPDPDTAEGE